MHSPETCGQSKQGTAGQVFCHLRKDPQGGLAPCVVNQGRDENCPLENTMQSGDSAIIQQGDAGER